MVRIKNIVRGRVGLILILAVVAFSCKSVKNITDTRVKVAPISRAKLISNVVEQELKFETLDIKKVVIDYKEKDKKMGLRGTIKIQRDSFIYIALSKINLSVAKLMLRPDKFILVSYIDKFVIEGNYDELSARLNTPVNYTVLQSIVTNKLFNAKWWIDEEFISIIGNANKERRVRKKEFKDFNLVKDDYNYYLQDWRSNKIEGVINSDKKKDRIAKRKDGEDLIFQKFSINPTTFNVERYLLEDLLFNRNIKVDYSSFKPLKNSRFPRGVKASFCNSNDTIMIKAKYDKISINQPLKTNLRVPARFKRHTSLER